MGQKQIAFRFTHQNSFNNMHQSWSDAGVHLERQPFPLVRHHKIPGSIFDSHLTLTPLIIYIAERFSSCLCIMKALAGIRWSHNKDTLFISRMPYAAHIWVKKAPISAVEKFQRAQNTCFLILSNFRRNSSVSCLHQKCTLLPISSTLSLICQQFLGRLTSARSSLVLCCYSLLRGSSR